MSRMMIVDGMSVLKTTSGGAAFLTNGFSYNFFTQLTATLKKFADVKGVIVCWEGGYDFRSKIYPEYKQHRNKSGGAAGGGSGAEIREQRAIVQNLLRRAGVDQVMAEGYEADDVAAHLVREFNVPMVLYSNDTDWLQLIRPGVSVYQKSEFSEGKKNLRVEITSERFHDYVGYPSPKELLRAKCVIGEDGDIGPRSGLEGVGPATVKLWLNGMDVPPSKKAKIEEFLGSDKFARNMLLIDLLTPRPLTLTWDKGQPSEEATLEFLQEVKWPSIYAPAKFPAWWEVYSNARL